MGGLHWYRAMLLSKKNVQRKKEIKEERKDLLHMYGFLESDTPLKISNFFSNLVLKREPFIFK